MFYTYLKYYRMYRLKDRDIQRFDVFRNFRFFRENHDFSLFSYVQTCIYAHLGPKGLRGHLPRNVPKSDAWSKFQGQVSKFRRKTVFFQRFFGFSVGAKNNYFVFIYIILTGAIIVYSRKHSPCHSHKVILIDVVSCGINYWQIPFY